MAGRLLFAFVCLLIAAGVTLPLYPREPAPPTVAVRSDPVQLVAGSEAIDCEDCAVAGRAECRPGCPCAGAVPAVFIPLEEPFGLTIAVTVRRHAAEPPAKLPARLPAI